MRIGILVGMLAVVGLALLPIAADDSDAEEQKHHAVVWFYYEDGSGLWGTATVEVGQTLNEALNGNYSWIGHWVDISTGYEYPKDKEIAKDTMLRASAEVPPQEPVPEPPDYTMIYFGIAVAVILAVIILLGKCWPKRY